MKLSLSLLLFIFATTAHGQTSANWTGAVGNWSDGTKWSTAPTAPINGQPGGSDIYSATLGNGQTITVDTSVQIETLNLSSGTITGASPLTLNTGFSFTSGMLTGAGTVNANGGAVFSGNFFKEITQSRVLNLGGNSTWTSGPISVSSGGQINHTATGTFDTNFDGTLSNRFSGAASFNNAGVFTKSGGTGSTTVSISFNNTGTVNVNSGTLSLSGGGTQASGLFNVAAGATLSFGGGTHTVAEAATLAGAGNLSFSGGNTTISGPYGLSGALTASGGGTGTISGSAVVATSVTVSGGTLNIESGTLETSTLTVSNGTLGGPAPLTASGLTTFTSGMLTGAGTVNANGGAVFSGNFFKEITQSRVLNLGGNSTWTSGPISVSSGGQINHTATGTFDTNFDGTLSNRFSGAASFNNAGVFTKSGGTGSTTVSISFNNTGTVNVNSGTLSLSGGVSQHSASTLIGGTWKVTNGASLSISTGTNITINQGNVTLDGSGSRFDKFTTALNSNQGALTLKNDRDLTTAGGLANSGALRIEDSTTLLAITGAFTQSLGSTTLVGAAQLTTSSFHLNGGTLGGTGTVNGNLVSNGSPLVAPGLSAGSLTINGNATLTGTLAMEIGGLAPATGHDQLVVTGTLGVGGNLSLALVDGYIPGYGKDLTLATTGAPIGGGFANVATGNRLLSANGIHSFAVHYGPTSPFGSHKIVLSELSDNVAPVLTLPTDITIEATGPVAMPVTFVVSANDAIQGPVAATANPASGSSFGLGETTVNVTASDIGGNTADGTFTIHVVDTTAPQLIVPASPVLATTLSTTGAAVNFSVSATDLVDPSPVIVATPASGSNFPLGDTQVNVTATDARGNQTVQSFTVRVTGLPDIAIKETFGAETADAVGSIAFGPVALNSSSPGKSFTVRNDGAAELLLRAITFDDELPLDFFATVPVATSLAPGESTTFSMTFRPAATGLRSAVLHVASNDPDPSESAFDIALNGIGFDLKLSAIAIVPAASGGPASISANITGGPPGSIVRLEASTDFGLSDPWVSILSVLLDVTGAGSITGAVDQGSLGADRDFFRIAYP